VGNSPLRHGRLHRPDKACERALGCRTAARICAHHGALGRPSRLSAAPRLYAVLKCPIAAGRFGWLLVAKLVTADTSSVFMLRSPLP